jgi:hypothetical protein
MVELTNLQKAIWKIVYGEDYYNSLEFRVGQLRFPVNRFMRALIDRLFYIEISKIEKFKNKNIKVFNNSYKDWQDFGSFLDTNYDVIEYEGDKWVIKITNHNGYVSYDGPNNKESEEIFKELDRKGFIKILGIKEESELYTFIYFTIDPEKVIIYHNYTRLMLKEL